MNGDEIRDDVVMTRGHDCSEESRLRGCDLQLKTLRPKLEDCEKALAHSEAENARLVAAVREHRDQRGDDRCWLDDQVLYKAAGLGETATGETALPPKCDFLKSCERYWHQRQAPFEHGQAPGAMTIAQLEADNARLADEAAGYRAEVERLAAKVAFMRNGWRVVLGAYLTSGGGIDPRHARDEADIRISAAVREWEKADKGGTR